MLFFFRETIHVILQKRRIKTHCVKLSTHLFQTFVLHLQINLKQFFNIFAQTSICFLFSKKPLLPFQHIHFLRVLHWIRTMKTIFDSYICWYVRNIDEEI